MLEQGLRYGATQYDSAACGQGGVCGSIFNFNDVSGVYTTLHKFVGNASGASASALIGDGHGSLVGTSPYGGVVNEPACGTATSPPSQIGCGFVFRLTPGMPFKALHKFAGGAHGGFPTGLVQRADGMFVGIAGGNTFAPIQVIYALSPTGSFTILHSCAGDALCGGGLSPHMLADSQGNVFMTSRTAPPGAPGAVILRLTPAGALQAVRRASDTTTTNEAFRLFSIDSVDTIYATLTSSVIGALPGPDYTTTVLALHTDSTVTKLARQHDLSISTLIPDEIDFPIGQHNPPSAVFGAAQYEFPDQPTSSQLFSISLP